MAFSLITSRYAGHDHRMLKVRNMPELLASVRLVNEPVRSRDPRFIREPANLCMLVTHWKGAIPAGGLICQEKIDGIRALWIDGRLVTREGNEIGGADHIAAELRAIETAFGRPMFLDGEFQVDGTLKATMRHFLQCGRYGPAGRLFLFDALPMTEWRSDTSGEALWARLDALTKVMAPISTEHVSVLTFHHCATAAEVTALAESVWARNGEGLVAKAPASL